MNLRKFICYMHLLKGLEAGIKKYLRTVRNYL